jgi:hypothetical protein
MGGPICSLSVKRIIGINHYNPKDDCQPPLAGSKGGFSNQLLTSPALKIVSFSVLSFVCSFNL